MMVVEGQRGGFSVWLLLRDPDGETAAKLPKGPLTDEIMEQVWRVNRLRDELVPIDDYVERVKAARSGFFRYRKDLKGWARYKSGYIPPWIEAYHGTGGAEE